MDFVETLKLIGAILAALIASRTIGAGARNWYLKGWGSRKVWRKKLNLLAVGATEEYVENLLGTPVFRNLEGPEIWQGNEEDTPKWVDHIFSTPHAWVVTRRVNDQLESWSVTVTDPKFWWDLEDVTFGKAKGRLGRSTFSELVDAPSGKYESAGARTAVYAESAYYGNPGAYQTFIFMHNQEGTGTCRTSGKGDVRTGEFSRPDDKGDYSAPEDESYRSESVVNTIIVTWYSSKMLHHEWQSWPVAITDQMRLLHRYQKKHGWRGKRSLGDGNGK
ncbi:ETEC_3214 domain-containing protein [Arthrobacter sp. ISL-28]|uniref:ETEC_3214 domain-containing protein n=1 Tax=Arthrobacter sp. ISL-28 TaxID=2819108 RepID=UPI001BE7BE9D|nr:ETEC_3214 domain-containing protein [Arthrobacter sp. ISL-28]MBT2521807.1 hypothetical protein [Arthrobacter sp. ISL-28]